MESRNPHENNNEIMYIEHSTDECIWFFQTDSVISIEEDTELYSLLDNFMKESYEFSDDYLKNIKDKNRTTVILFELHKKKEIEDYLK